MTFLYPGATPPFFGSSCHIHILLPSRASPSSSPSLSLSIYFSSLRRAHSKLYPRFTSAVWTKRGAATLCGIILSRKICRSETSHRIQTSVRLPVTDEDPITGPRANRRRRSSKSSCSTLAMVELAGSGLAGVRHLRGERGELRRPRTTTTAVRPRAFAGSGGCSHANNTPTVKGGPLPRAPRVSPRQRRRIEDTHAYLCARVDPVMGSLILALMEGRPEDIHEAALEHLLSKRREKDGGGDDQTGSTIVRSERQSGVNGGGSSASAPTGNGGEEAVAEQRRLARRQDRLFMAREIGPLVTELIRRTLHYMPTDVESFLIEQLQGGITPGGGGGAGRQNEVNNRRPYPPPEGGDPADIRKNRPTRPSTARSRLQQAQSLDFHVQQTSPPLSGRMTEARRSPSPPRGPRNGGLSDEEDDVCGQDGGRASPPSRGVVAGVKESQNKPWDVEVWKKWENKLVCWC